ncbi:hypothetical protein HDU91_001032, partial [Kappamyces sp. JEL0680]
MSSKAKAAAERALKKESKKNVKVLPIIKFYLIAYNFLSCYGWLAVLYQTIDYLLLNNGHYQGVYPVVGKLLQVVQTAALLEVVHATIGIVKAAPNPTIMQVSSRLYIVWYILAAYPVKEVYSSPFFTSMVIAWCITEIVRYSYYGLGLLLGTAPYVSVWMRYSFFFVLYPIGAFSEFMLVQHARPLEPRLWVTVIMTAISAIYGPGKQRALTAGFYYMYTHMIK